MTHRKSDSARPSPSSQSSPVPKSRPIFESEADERAFWESNDSTEFVDWGQATTATLPNLKPSTKTISLRLPASLLNSIKAEANRRDVPYQSLIKVWLARDVEAARAEPPSRD